MGIGCAIRGSGALWLGSLALGRDAGLALVCPELYLATYLSNISVSREAHASRATIITERDCCQFSGYLWVSREGSGYQGGIWALTSFSTSFRAYADTLFILFHPIFLFSSSYLFFFFFLFTSRYLYGVLGSSLSVPYQFPRYLYVSLLVLYVSL